MLIAKSFHDNNLILISCCSCRNCKKTFNLLTATSWRLKLAMTYNGAWCGIVHHILLPVQWKSNLQDGKARKRAQKVLSFCWIATTCEFLRTPNHFRIAFQCTNRAGKLRKKFSSNLRDSSAEIPFLMEIPKRGAKISLGNVFSTQLARAHKFLHRCVVSCCVTKFAN